MMALPSKTYKKVYDCSRQDLVSTWTGEELLNGKPERSFTVIMRTRGCSWSLKSGCTMCGYHAASNPSIRSEALKLQLEEALSGYDGEAVVKIYTSGSFLDEGEVPGDVAISILEAFDAKRIIVESRPEYVNTGILESYADSAPQLEIAMGLESSNDFILEHCINKGFTVEDYRVARDIILANDCHLRTYLLLKPPFLTETEAMEDLASSITAVSHPQNTVSVNPLNVQKDTLVERLWYRREYRPPWIWSLFQAILSSEIRGPLVISRAGVGSKRGAQNCGSCHDVLLGNIDDFNLTGDTEILKRSFSVCDCTREWAAQKDISALLHYRGSHEILCDRYAGYM